MASDKDWVLVPREPTVAMRVAGLDERNRPGSGASVTTIYAAMIAAAPPASQPVMGALREFDVLGYIENYAYAGEGGDYTPTQDECALLVDAIEGVLYEIERASRAPQLVVTDEMVEAAWSAYSSHLPAGLRSETMPPLMGAPLRAALSAALALQPAPAPQVDRDAVIEECIRALQRHVMNSGSERFAAYVQMASDAIIRSLKTKGGE